MLLKVKETRDDDRCLLVFSGSGGEEVFLDLAVISIDVVDVS